MALYISPARRRRRTLLLSGSMLVGGLVVGFASGRWSAPSTAEAIQSSRLAGEQLAARVQALTIEYEQALAGQGDTVQGGVLDALTSIESDTASAERVARWIDSRDRAKVAAALTAVRQGASNRVANDQFAALTDEAATTLRDTFGAE